MAKTLKKLSKKKLRKLVNLAADELVSVRVEVKRLREQVEQLSKPNYDMSQLVEAILKADANKLLQKTVREGLADLGDRATMMDLGYMPNEDGTWRDGATSDKITGLIQEPRMEPSYPCMHCGHINRGMRYSMEAKCTKCNKSTAPYLEMRVENPCDCIDCEARRQQEQITLSGVRKHTCHYSLCNRKDPCDCPGCTANRAEQASARN